MVRPRPLVLSQSSFILGCWILCRNDARSGKSWNTFFWNNRGI